MLVQGDGFFVDASANIIAILLDGQSLGVRVRNGG
jgi:hypothetical protein